MQRENIKKVTKQHNSPSQMRFSLEAIWRFRKLSLVHFVVMKFSIEISMKQSLINHTAGWLPAISGSNYKKHYWPHIESNPKRLTHSWIKYDSTEKFQSRLQKISWFCWKICSLNSIQCQRMRRHNLVQRLCWLQSRSFPTHPYRQTRLRDEKVWSVFVYQVAARV